MLKLIKKLLTFIRKNEMLKQASKQASKQANYCLAKKKGGMLTKYTSFNLLERGGIC